MVPSSRAAVRADRLRAVNAPRPATVERDASGTPVAMNASDSRTVGPSDGKINVEFVNEAWRIDDEWWREPIHRRYFEVVLEDGRRAVLFEDVSTGDWFIQKP